MPIDTGTARVERDPDNPYGLTLFVNGAPSSYIDLADPTILDFEYMQQMACVLDAMADGPLRVLHLGAAGCSLARYVDAVRPGSHQRGIDIDARLLELARQWFSLPRSPRLRLRCDDARRAVRTLAPATVDVVVRDVFAGDATPGELTTLEFTAEVRRALTPHGVYLANCAGKPSLTQARHEAATILAGWGGHADQVAVITEPGIWRGRRFGNVVVAASDGGVDLAAASLGRRLRTLATPARIVTGDELVDFVGVTAARREGDLSPEIPVQAPK